MDPRLEGVTDDDLHEQFHLASQIRDKTSAANEAVIQIRDIRTQVEQRLEQISDRGLTRRARDFLENVGAIEEALYQVRNRSGQDPLNFPIRLNNRLASLRRSVENGDTRPTDAAYTVFAELSGELEGHLTNLDAALARDLADLNRRLERVNLEPIAVRSRGATTPS